MRVTVRWQWLEDEAAPGWDATRCLFALADPESDEILYLGEAGDATVREKCESHDLERLWAELRGIGVEQVSVLVGTPEPAAAAEAAALLVAELQPSGNAGSVAREPSIALEVECAGDWPYEETRFIAT